jgi:hypothetical protein
MTSPDSEPTPWPSEQATLEHRAISNLLKVYKQQPEAWAPHSWGEDATGRFNVADTGDEESGEVWGKLYAPQSEAEEAARGAPEWIDFCDRVQVFTRRLNPEWLDTPGVLPAVESVNPCFFGVKDSGAGMWRISRSDPAIIMQPTEAEMTRFYQLFGTEQ